MASSIVSTFILVSFLLFITTSLGHEREEDQVLVEPPNTRGEPGPGPWGTRKESPEFRVVCYYYAVEAWYRRGKGMMVPEDIDPELCTHIHYAYGTLDPQTLLISSSDPWADFDNKFYQRTIALKGRNPKLKVILSVGGWNEPSERFASLILSSPQTRKSFIQDAIQFLRLHHFDGLDLAWFFPVCWEGQCSKQYETKDKRESERHQFGSFLRDLRGSFDKLETPLLLTATVSGDPEVIDLAYEASGLSKLDYINVMAFDYPIYWNGKTVHHASLYAQKHFPSQFTSNFSTLLYVKKGIPPRKINLGIPTYARSFTLAHPQSHGIGAPIKGPGNPGEFTATPGILAYYEVCDRVINQGWKKEIDYETGLIYSHHNDQWISYENVETVAMKAKHVKKSGFGGVMVWDIDRDDFKGSCSNLKFPILSSVAHQLLKETQTSIHPRFTRMHTRDRLRKVSKP